MKTTATTRTKEEGKDKERAKATKASSPAGEVVNQEQQRQPGSVHVHSCTYGRPVITVDALNTLFRKQCATTAEESEGANEHSIVNVFLKSMEHLVGSSPSFTFSDVSMLLRPYQYPLAELKRLFDSWVAFAKQWHKVSGCSAVYDEEVFQWV